MTLLLAIAFAVPAQLPASGTMPGKESLQKHIAAAEAARNANDVSQQAMSSLLAGMTAIALEDEIVARKHLQESMRLFESLRDHAGAWLAYISLAELEKSTTDYDAAVALYARAVAVLEKAASPGEKFSIQRLQSMGDLFGFGSLPGPGGGLPEELFKPILLLFANVMTRDGYGSALLDAGQLEKAEAELLRAQQESSMFGGIFDVSLSAHLGDLRRRQWRFDDARAEYQKALGGAAVVAMFMPNDERIRLRILSQLADVEMLSGRTAEALAWNDRALAIVRAAGDLRGESRILQERGALLFRARRLDAAASVLEEAMTIAAAAGADARRGEILVQLALLSMTRGRYGTAAAQLEKAIEFLQKAGDVISESGAWATLANVYMIMDLRTHAKAATDKAETLATKTGFRAARVVADLTAMTHCYLAGEASGAEFEAALARMWATPEAGALLLRPDADTFAGVISTPAAAGLDGATLSVPAPQETLSLMSSINALIEGRSLVRRNEFAAARAVLERGLATTPNAEYVPAFLLLTGVTWAKEGNLDNASAAFADAAEMLETTMDDIRVEEMLAGYLGTGRNVYFEMLIETLVQQERVAEAFEASERARARAFLQLIGNSRIQASGAGSPDPQLVREAEALRVQISEWQSAGAFDVNPRARAADLRRARERYEMLLTRIKTSRAEYASITTVPPLSVDDVREELPPDTTLVSYFVTPWSVHVWLVSSSGVQHIALPAGAVAVAQAECWAGVVGPRGVRPRNRENPCGDQATAEHVYRALFLPVREKLSTRRLLIVAHGALHYVPFAALRDPDTGRYLVEDFTLAYAPSASTLRFVREKETPVDGTAIVFGDPRAAELDQLPHAEQEAMRVAAMLEAAPLLGHEAMESRLYELDGAVDLVHIAAHGSYDRDHPLFSRIALAPGEGRDGNLEVHEVLGELDLSGVNLVVLAACDTAVGKRSGGDDVVGLTRALLYAGTPGVIAALWKVPDDATAMLMDELYCRLRSGEDAAVALQEAQMSMLRGAAFAEPRQWAGFALYGAPRGRWSQTAQTKSPQEGQ